MSTPIPTIPVRIVLDNRNSDGWISRLLATPEPALAGKVAFISNLNSTIQELEPGQIWDAMPVEQNDRYWTVQLVARRS